ncbi:MAG TPA: hypothetical protein VJS44_03080 [Pyrinomonadaceae bacterium]|nr:hypothetical protein [Pyrinomonadaceae bacterium]
MSKAQYLLIAGFIGFYGLLFTYLVVRALAGNIHARFARVRPAAVVKRPSAGSARRAWTAALWRNA